MRRVWLLFLFCGLAAATASAAAAQTTLTFDDVFSGTDYQLIPDGYGGFNWTFAGVIHRDFYPGSGYDNGTVSGDYVAYNHVGLDVDMTLEGGGGFNVFSAYLTAAWNDGLDFVAKGYRAGVEVFSKSAVLNTAGPQLVEFDFMNIDQMTFSTPEGNLGSQFAMDNLVVGVVPEPITLTLLLPGLLGIAAARRRRREDLLA